MENLKNARLFIVKGKLESPSGRSPSLNFEPLKDSAGYLTVMNPSIVNQTLLKFLTRLPRVRSDIRPPSVPIPQRMREALNTLAELTGDSSFSGKDGMCPLNFSCVSPEVCKIQSKSRELYAKDSIHAFSPLQSNGRPIRCVETSLTMIWIRSTPILLPVPSQPVFVRRVGGEH